VDRLQNALLLFGAGGRLGRAVSETAAKGGVAVESIPWREAQSLATAKPEEIRARLAVADGRVDIVFAGGLIDPRFAVSDLMAANVNVPLRLIKGTAGDPRFRYVTIGSILETFAVLAASNAYLASKAELWTQARRLSDVHRLGGRIVHLRLHTLYGGPPAPHSFLGQIHDSLKSDRPFHMSSGEQLREYNHVDDVARSITMLLSRDWHGPLDLNLSTGNPVQLRDLAQRIFAAFGRSGSLTIGAIDAPKGENLDRRFPPAPDWLLDRPREPVAGIIDWLASLLGWRPYDS
jgi:nucleoside-diphosphate-sugar epimerase